MSLGKYSERLYQGILSELRTIWQFDTQMRNTIRAATACTFAIWLAFFLHVDEPFWSGVSAFVAMQSNMGSTLRKSTVRFVGTIGGALLSLLIVALFLNQTVIFMVAIFVAVAGGIYLSVIDRKYWYVWLIGFVTLSMVALGGLSDPTPNTFIKLAFDRSFEVSLGIFASIIVSAIILPVSATQKTTTSLAATFTPLQLLIDTYAEAFITPSDQHNQNFDSQTKQFVQTLEAAEQLISDASLEQKATYQTKVVTQCAHAVRHCFEYLLHHYRHYISQQQPNDYTQHFKMHIQAYKKLAKHIVAEVQNNMMQPDQNQHLKQQNLLRQLDEQWQALEHTYAESRNQELNLHFAPEVIDASVQSLLALHTCLKQLVLGVLPKESDQPKQAVARPPWHKRLTHYNVFYVKHSLVGAMAILFAPLFWLAMALPGFQQVAVSIGAAIGMDPDASHYKGFLRFCGCLFGAILVFGILALNIQNLMIMLLIIFCGAMVTLYFHYGSPQISYFGTQAAVVFFIGLIYNLAPVTNLEPSILRLTGIFLGVAALVAFQYVFWPYRSQAILTHHIRQIFLHLYPLASQYQSLKIRGAHPIFWPLLIQLRIRLKEFNQFCLDADPEIQATAIQYRNCLTDLFHSLFCLIMTVNEIDNPTVIEQQYAQFHQFLHAALQPLIDIQAEQIHNMTEQHAALHTLKAEITKLRNKLRAQRTTTLIGIQASFQLVTLVRLTEIVACDVDTLLQVHESYAAWTQGEIATT